MKKTFLAMLALLLPLMMFVSWSNESAAAASKGKVVLDNREVAMPAGVGPENVNGSIMIPIRAVSESLGYAVSWDQKARIVTINQDLKTIRLTVGSKRADADGVTLDLNAAPKQKGGTILVPIRFVGEQFGLSVGWDNQDKTVYLSANPIAGTPAPTAAQSPASPSPTSPSVLNPSPVPTPAPSAIPGSVAGSPVTTASPAAGTPGPAAQVLVKGASFGENKLMIAVDGTVVPSISADNSGRILVDIPASTLAAEFAAGGTGGELDTAGYPLVAGISYYTVAESAASVRFEIRTTQTMSYQVSVDSAAGLITIDLNAGGQGNSGNGADGKPVVVLDAGHGGTQPGAISAAGHKEKDFNLAVILKAGTLLESDGRVTVIYTRTSDSTLGLEDRVSTAERAGADLFVSLHANAMPTTASGWNLVNGSETYYTRSESLPLARIMHKHLVAGTGFKDNGIRSKSLHVTRETTMPAVLLEAGYLTNVSEEAKLYSDSLQNSLAQEIAAGILEYLGL